MFYEMRKMERRMTDDDMKQILKQNEYGVLSTIGKDGYPYGVPLSYVYKDNQLIFHGAQMGHKLDNIRYQEKVSFCVVGKTEVLPEKFSTKYESVIVFGKIRELSESEKSVCLKELIAKYSSDFMKEGLEYINRAAGKTEVLVLTIEHMTGKARR